MGGTSTDVSRFGGSFEHVFETVTAGVSVQSAQLDINTVAAGGGSMLFWKNGMFKVGPEVYHLFPKAMSYANLKLSSSKPLISPTECWGTPRPCILPQRRPADCNRRELIVGSLLSSMTDVYSISQSLGRLVPEYFPSIFGPEEDLPLDSDVCAKLFKDLAARINSDTGKSMTPYDVAHGFIDVANESMCRPIRALTEARGFETAQHNLATFGGAGGQHACEIAKKLGIHRVVIHRYSSILSAYGMALAEVVQEAREPSSETLSEDALPRLEDKFAGLKSKVTNGLLSQGILNASIVHEEFLNLRYHGTDTNFMIIRPKDGDWLSALEAEHYRELSFTFPRTRKVLVDDVRVRGVGKSDEVSKDNENLVDELQSLSFCPEEKGPDLMVRDVSPEIHHPGHALV